MCLLIFPKIQLVGNSVSYKLSLIKHTACIPVLALSSSPGRRTASLALSLELRLDGGANGQPPTPGQAGRQADLQQSHALARLA